ncbi:MAG: cobalamin-dependent protein [Gammaproteobacteria bacterium]|nr:cobalamin-dependent protein [Gammaproteobacteria bacterium]
MQPEEQKQLLIQQIADMMEDEAVALAKQMLAEGYPPLELLGHCREAMEIVGKRYETGEYFLPELMLAGEMLGSIGEIAKPLIDQGAGTKAKGATVLIGTVHGDLHDIGKNIVSFMLDINGYNVIDIGIDVPVEEFIRNIREHKPVVVGLSGFLTLAFDSMKETIQRIEAEGLRQGMKIMIGGGQVDETILKHTGADAYGMNAMDAVNLCKNWIPA